MWLSGTVTGDDFFFSTRSVHLLQIKQIKSDELRTRNTGWASKVNISIFYLYSHGNDNQPVNVCAHVQTLSPRYFTYCWIHSLTENSTAAVEWILKHLVVLCHSSCSAWFAFRFSDVIQWEHLLRLVLIHICSRCHSIFNKTSPFLLFCDDHFKGSDWW